MLISLNELKKYVQIPSGITTEALLDLIGSRLVEIEDTHDLTPKYQGMYVVKVISAEKIAGTHLTLCQIDAGAHSGEFNTVSATPDGESSETGNIGSKTVPTVQVVCGAPNVYAGMLAVWIAPGSIVPETYGNENFRLSVRKLQGYESNGMLAAVDELDLGTDHAGIAEIDPKMTITINGESRPVQPGDSLAEAFGLNDIIIDVENKSLTHRPDCFGLIGFARELAGILGLPFQEPDWLSGDYSIVAEESTTAGARSGAAEHKDSARAARSVSGGHAASPRVVTSEDLCPRYSCAVFDLKDNTPSKYLTPDAIFLAKAGMRSIDPMVDLTNIMMLETGQPLHAFDYDKFIAVGGGKTPQIIVRAARAGETLQLLDGETIECVPEDILITSNDVPVALAGAMGGKNTEVDASTRRIVLESATFSLFHLRKTQMAHGIFSEAITRFTKGQPAAMTLPVLSETLRRLDISDATIADEYPTPVVPTKITLSVADINTLLGSSYDTKTIVRTLENVGFQVQNQADTLEVTAPLWRTDIHIKEDVIEEVGRLLGFDNIPLSLPEKPFSGTELSPMLRLKQDLRHFLSGALGMNELLTYSFISKSLLEKVGQNLSESYEIVNSISPELQCFRQQIVPSLLDKVRENLKAGHQGFSLYELNQVSQKSWGFTPEDTPVLKTDLGIVTLGDFYNLKSALLTLTRRGLHLNLEYAQLSAKAATEYPYLEPARSAMILANGAIIGAFGELKALVLRKFKLDGPVSVAELCLDPLLDLPRTLNFQLKLSKFPFVERDLTLKVAADAQFGRFYDLIDQVLKAEQLISETTPVSIYQANPDDTTKNISFHLKFSSPDKTLEQSAISAIMEKVTVEVVKLGAEVV